MAKLQSIFYITNLESFVTIFEIKPFSAVQDAKLLFFIDTKLPVPKSKILFKYE